MKGFLVLFLCLNNLLIAQVDSGFLLNTGLSPKNDEYKTLVIEKYILNVPLKKKITKKNESFNLCDSFNLFISLSGINIGLNDYINLKLNSLYYREFETNKSSIEYDTLPTGCIKQKKIKLFLKLLLRLGSCPHELKK